MYALRHANLAPTYLNFSPNSDSKRYKNILLLMFFFFPFSFRFPFDIWRQKLLLPKYSYSEL